MKAYFRIKSLDPNRTYYASITPKKKDSIPYDIKIVGREVYYTEVKEEIEVLRADVEMIEEINKKEVGTVSGGVKDAEIVEEKPQGHTQTKQAKDELKEEKKEDKK